MDTYVDYVENKLNILEHSLSEFDQRQKKLKKDLFIARTAFGVMTIIVFIVLGLWIDQGIRKNALNNANFALTHQLYSLEMEVKGYLAEIDAISTTLVSDRLYYEEEIKNIVETYTALTNKIITTYSKSVSAYMAEVSNLRTENAKLLKDNEEMRTVLNEFNAAFAKKIQANATNASYKMATEYTLEPIGNFSVTGYSLYELPWQHGITSSGRKVKDGITIAVDRSIIPHGSWVYIEGYGLRRADDSGSAIVGNEIDMYHEAYNDALAFGRQNLKVWIVNPKNI